MRKVKMSDTIDVFYDGACGLCAREINHYKKIAPENTFNWIDITKTAQPFTSLGYKFSDGLKALHVRDTAGNMHIGVNAFIVIWQHLEGWKILAFLVNLPIVNSIAAFTYRHFARWRFKKLGYTE